MTDKPDAKSLSDIMSDEHFETFMARQGAHNSRMFESQERHRVACEKLVVITEEQMKDKAKDKRDYFAGQALAGLIAHHGNDDCHDGARASYEFADAMIAERDK